MCTVGISDVSKVHHSRAIFVTKSSYFPLSRFLSNITRAVVDSSRCCFRTAAEQYSIQVLFAALLRREHTREESPIKAPFRVDAIFVRVSTPSFESRRRATGTNPPHVSFLLNTHEGHSAKYKLEEAQRGGGSWPSCIPRTACAGILVVRAFRDHRTRGSRVTFNICLRY